MTDISQEQMDIVLLRAVRENDRPEMARMIAAGANLQCVDENWHSPLFIAVSAGRLREAQMLLEAGALPDWSHPKLGRSPLFAAAGTSPELVALLLSKGADPNRSAPNAPLLWAAHEGEVEIARLLLSAGADVNVRHTAAKSTPLHSCAHGRSGRSGGVEVAEILLAAGADINAEDDLGHTPLSKAVRLGDDLFFDWMLRREGLSQRCLDESLVAAVTMGREAAIVQRLIDRGADAVQRVGGKTLLQLAPRAADDVKRVLRSVRTQRSIADAMNDCAGADAPAAPRKDFTL